MSCSRAVCFVIAACAISLSSSAAAQTPGKDAFVEAVADFSQATAGLVGNEGPKLKASLDAMAAALARWDSAVARVEAGFKAAITGASPEAAAAMRGTIGAAYLERGRVSEAVLHLDAAAMFPHAPATVHLLRGLAHTTLGRPSTAAEAFAVARRANPLDATTAYLYLRSTADAKGASDRAEALNTLARAVAEIAEPGPHVPQLAVPVFDAIDDASVDVPLFLLASYAEGTALFRQAKYVEAVASWRAAVAADTLVTDTALASPEARAAVDALARGDAKAAVERLESAPAVERSSELQRLTGLAHWARGDHASSLRRLRAAIRLNPRDERARLASADVLVAAGNRNAARSSLLDTVRLFPRSGQAQWRLGRLLRELGDEAGALRAYDAAARLVPLAGASVLQAAIGSLRHNNFDVAAARAAYAARVERAPNVSQSHVDLGSIYLAEDRVDDAWIEFAAAVLVDPTNARAFAALGQVRANQGDDADAVRMLAAAVRLDPQLVEGRYALSRALLRLGRTDDARRELEAYERLQKSAMEAQRRQFDANSRVIEGALREGRTEGGAR